MTDILLFKIEKNQTVQLNKNRVKLEKNLQELIQNNLKEFFRIDFLATEFTLGKNEGRIDTLGIDENNSPVIIEYKRNINENVITQILSYYDWIMEHQAEFERLLVQKNYSTVKVDWTSPKLICIAEDFNKHDFKAVKRISANIQLIRYQIFDDDYILFELIGVERTIGKKQVKKSVKSREEIKLSRANEKVKQLFSLVDSFIQNLGENISLKGLEQYFAYSKINNFASLLIQKESIRLYLHLDPSDILQLPSFARDVTGLGHYGTGNLEITIRSESDLEEVKPLIERSYMKS